MAPRRDKRNGPRFSSRSGIIPDSRKPSDITKDLWLRRELAGPSRRDLRGTEELLRPYSHLKRGGYVLTLLYDSEVLDASTESRLGYISDKKLSERLRVYLPKSFREPLTVSTAGLEQFGKWIGISVTSRVLDIEREAILSGLNSIYGTAFAWDTRLHLSLAEGQLTRFNNRQQILDSLPGEVSLSPGEGAFTEK